MKNSRYELIKIIIVISIIAVFLISYICIIDSDTKKSKETTTVDAIVIEKIYEETETYSTTKIKYKLKLSEINSTESFYLDCKYPLYSKTNVNDTLQLNKTIISKNNKDTVFYDFVR